MEKGNEVCSVLLISMEAGRIMLENGAEIFRVEDTMKRIAASFGVNDENFFVLSNGIFSSGEDSEGRLFAKVEHIPVHGADLSKVIAINQLSREISQGMYTLEEVGKKLEDIRKAPNRPWPIQVFATALGAGCFTVLLNGNLMDGTASFISGIFLGFFIQFIFKPYLSKMTGNILGGAVTAAICVFFLHIGFSSNLISMIGGGVIPLVPGVAFVNGIRDIGDEDYISGAVRLLDAVLVFICIAVGVASVLMIYSALTGGRVL